MFNDRVRIEVLAGRGGDGAIGFRREKYVPKGGPDGGDGGPGGDVAAIADSDLRDLSSLQRKRLFKAGRGGAGGRAGRHGASGDSVELRVPVGTQVLDAEGQVLADLTTPAARVVLAHGGAGGRGNRHFATPARQAPRFAEVGLPGEEAELQLHLKLLADAALVGLPNAGKSSLVRQLSNARPKVAEYPFTTLSPVLGTVDAPDGRQLTVADVPGLIEGASEGVGLGHEFLAHLERARTLLHVIDAAAGEPEEQFRTIDAELAAYGAGLDALPQIVVLNKLDLLPEPPTFELDDPRIVGVFALSAATGQGVAGLKQALFDLLPPSAESPPDAAGMVDFLVYRPRRRARTFRIFRTESGFKVVGRPPSEEELEKALRAAGAKAGDEVVVGEEVLELPVIGLFGGAFDPPHNGHVAIVDEAARHFDLARIVVMVVADPGHKEVVLDAPARLDLARAAFPGLAVELDRHARTVELLRERHFDDPLFLIGADEFCDFLSWQEPEAVLELARLGVATRPGFPRERLDRVLDALSAPDRVQLFEIEPVPVSSSELRARVARGESLKGLVPAAVEKLIRERGLYRRAGYTKPQVPGRPE